ncbi:hypothetical protein EMIHUDRAFT_451967, partial [Emiliania huxleyi CCMP1516]|uniref:Uncharacterized protein n=2 Tax=Emiliania huxleyi TaxID=2903 RepID=A0A0D3IQI1_EMIH1
RWATRHGPTERQEPPVHGVVLDAAAIRRALHVPDGRNAWRRLRRLLRCRLCQPAAARLPHDGGHALSWPARRKLRSDALRVLLYSDADAVVGRDADADCRDAPLHRGRAAARRRRQRLRRHECGHACRPVRCPDAAPDAVRNGRLANGLRRHGVDAAGAGCVPRPADDARVRDASGVQLDAAQRRRLRTARFSTPAARAADAAASPPTRGGVACRLPASLGGRQGEADRHAAQRPLAGDARAGAGADVRPRGRRDRHRRGAVRLLLKVEEAAAVRRDLRLPVPARRRAVRAGALHLARRGGEAGAARGHRRAAAAQGRLPPPAAAARAPARPASRPRHQPGRASGPRHGARLPLPAVHAADARARADGRPGAHPLRRRDPAALRARRLDRLQDGPPPHLRRGQRAAGPRPGPPAGDRAARHPVDGAVARRAGAQVHARHRPPALAGRRHLAPQQGRRADAL